MIPALVLTAGLATRLRPLSLVRAKAALPVAGDVIARRILLWLSGAGVSEAVLNLHHLPHTITRLVGDGHDLGLRVRYSWEVPVLGSAGGPRRALPILAPERGDSRATFLIVNGDTITDVNVPALTARHRASKALVTLAVVPNTEPMKYGGVLVDDADVVTGFVARGATQPSYHFVGVQAADAAAFADVPPGVPYESINRLYPALIGARPGSIRAFRASAEFFDIGTPQDYLATSLLLAGREQRELSGAGTIVDPSARVQRSVLWDDVVVEPGAMLRECIVTDGVRVPEDTSWHGVILRRDDGALVDGEKRVEGMIVRAIDTSELGD